jgi:thioredoxin reductase (NADPH)
MTSDYAPTPVEDFLDPDDPTLFPRLTPEQVEYLAEIGTQLSFARGELVFEHGQRETPLYVVLSGALDIIDRAPEGDRYFTQCRPWTFAADISMFTGEPTLAAGFAAEPTSLLALPPEDVHRVVATRPERALGSRTTSAFQPVLPARSSPDGRHSRRASSAP